MIIIQRDYQDLSGRNRRFRRHRHPSRRFPASVQDTTASIHRLAYRPCCPCSSNSGQGPRQRSMPTAATISISSQCAGWRRARTICWMAACSVHTAFIWSSKYCIFLWRERSPFGMRKFKQITPRI
ncbi:hypothetical protein DAI22_03g256932 [Oryza sativa Japonica Group]|nr:hypothetical protein DAI22_03g256932 [Oryza sativa Japonica Group]KAF2940239.1 hypothetical protein DAI22_03g256932 [Oryza sativa Japonica Group]